LLFAAVATSRCISSYTWHLYLWKVDLNVDERLKQHGLF
jgi:hypothetical protein